MDAERRAEIGRLFAKAREQANALDDVLTDLSCAVDGYYRAEQYVGRMAGSDVNSVMYWLDEAKKEVGRRVASYCSAWRDAVQKAGRGWLAFYSLRHIAATMMIAAGADVAAVAANLGHASPATTLNAYAHALPQAQRQASAVLGAAWCGMAKAIPEKTGS